MKKNMKMDKIKPGDCYKQLEVSSTKEKQFIKNLYSGRHSKLTLEQIVIWFPQGRRLDAKDGFTLSSLVIRDHTKL